MKKHISILGSTGSIGRSTLEVVRHLGSQFEVVGLAAKSNIDLLEAQAKEFSPTLIAVYDEEKAEELRSRLPAIKIVSGLSGLQEVAAYAPANIVVSALMGAIGILPTLAAIEAGKTVALANKEVLVSAGRLVMDLAHRKGVKILPVDSEHCALFQCLGDRPLKEIRRLIITASGGPFLHEPEENLQHITVERALAHPTWRMGPKITIDSSTLMNKGLEVIEAHFLFGVPVEQIEVVVHPQSVIHSMVEFVDGSILAQMSEPNMVHPIQYALTYPERQPGFLKPFDFTRYPRLEFLPPNTKNFPCLKLAFDALRTGGVAPCFLNAANEVLVERFLEGKIRWNEIGSTLQSLMLRQNFPRDSEDITLEKILETDRLGRNIGIVGYL